VNAVFLQENYGIFSLRTIDLHLLRKVIQTEDTELKSALKGKHDVSLSTESNRRTDPSNFASTDGQADLALMDRLPKTG